MQTPHIGLYCSMLWTWFTFTSYSDFVSRRMRCILILKFLSGRSSARRDAPLVRWGVLLNSFQMMLTEVHLLGRKYQNRDINLVSREQILHSF